MHPDAEAKLRDVVRSVLQVPPDFDIARASQLSVESWDSLAHVSLMLALEGEFSVTIDIADQLELTSYDSIRLYLEQHSA